MVATVVGSGLLLAPSSVAGDPGGLSDQLDSRAAAPRVVHTFVSAPDLLNGDIGDARRSPFWRPGMPNSWNSSWQRNIRNVFGQVADVPGADSYLVAGDLVDGRWHRDRYASGVFGPGRTQRQQLARITTAADVYYREWKRFWREAGVGPDRVHTAVGDHEVGDNPWIPGELKFTAFERFKRAYAARFTLTEGRHRYREHPRGTKFDDTAYATYLHPKVLLVTVDVFDRTRRGVDATVNHGQLAWLDRTLAAVPEDVTVLVQGHTPVLTPVRQRSSSGLVMDAGEEESSPFWQVLRRHDVDLYLAGEVHEFTTVAREPGDPVQITHGGYAATGRTDYLVGDVRADGSIALRALTIPLLWRSRAALWQTDRDIVPRYLRTAKRSRTVGRLVVGPDGSVVTSSGRLRPWSGPGSS